MGRGAPPRQSTPPHLHLSTPPTLPDVPSRRRSCCSMHRFAPQVPLPLGRRLGLGQPSESILSSVRYTCRNTGRPATASPDLPNRKPDHTLQSVIAWTPPRTRSPCPLPSHGPSSHASSLAPPSATLPAPLGPPGFDEIGPEPKPTIADGSDPSSDAEHPTRQPPTDHRTARIQSRDDHTLQSVIVPEKRVRSSGIGADPLRVPPRSLPSV